MDGWYEQIEQGIRDVVRLLRDNGFNTTCSCEHKMFVDVELTNNIDVVETLACLLWDSGHRNFRIEVTLRVPPDGYWGRRATVFIGVWDDSSWHLGYVEGVKAAKEGRE